MSMLLGPNEAMCPSFEIMGLRKFTAFVDDMYFKGMSLVMYASLTVVASSRTISVPNCLACAIGMIL